MYEFLNCSTTDTMDIVYETILVTLQNSIYGSCRFEITVNEFSLSYTKELSQGFLKKQAEPKSRYFRKTDSLLSTGQKFR